MIFDPRFAHEYAFGGSTAEDLAAVQQKTQERDGLLAEIYSTLRDPNAALTHLLIPARKLVANHGQDNHIAGPMSALVDYLAKRDMTLAIELASEIQELAPNTVIAGNAAYRLKELKAPAQAVELPTTLIPGQFTRLVQELA